MFVGVLITSLHIDIDFTSRLKLFKRQPRKMVKHTQTTRRQFADELFIVFDHLVGLPLKVCLM